MYYFLPSGPRKLNPNVQDWLPSRGTRHLTDQRLPLDCGANCRGAEGQRWTSSGHGIHVLAEPRDKATQDISRSIIRPGILCSKSQPGQNIRTNDKENTDSDLGKDISKLSDSDTVEVDEDTAQGKTWYTEAQLQTIPQRRPFYLHIAGVSLPQPNIQMKIYW